MECYKDKDVVIMKLTNEDLDNPQKSLNILESLLRDEYERKFVADLSKMEAIYSIQIGTLVSMHVMCYENVAVMKLAGASDKVKELLRMVGLEAMMEMHHGAAVAAQSFGPPTGNSPKLMPETQKRQPRPGDPRVK
jgi:anti-anti-sigma regulatory factor